MFLVSSWITAKFSPLILYSILYPDISGTLSANSGSSHKTTIDVGDTGNASGFSGLFGTVACASISNLNAWILSLSESATNNRSFVVSNAIPIGESNFPSDVPVEPNSSIKQTPSTIFFVPFGQISSSVIWKTWILLLSVSAIYNKLFVESNARPVGSSNFPSPLPAEPNFFTKQTPSTDSIVPLGQVVPSTNSKTIILSFPESETYNISSELSITMFVGFLKSSFPSNKSKSNKKSPVESKTEIESLSMFETKISLVESCTATPLVVPK